MAIKQEVNAPLLLTIAMIGGFLLLVIVIGVQAWYLWAEQGELRAKYDAARNVDLERMIASQEANLARPRLTADGRATIPIEQAMDLIVQNGGRLPATQQAQ